MREISASEVASVVKDLCFKANFMLRQDILDGIKRSLPAELSAVGKEVLEQIIKNAEIAAREKLPLCQDTGYVTVFLEIGQNVLIKGDLTSAVNEGVRQAYLEGYLRKSMVASPIFERENTLDNTPAFINVDLVAGDKVKIIVMPKGGGTENASQLRMLPVSEGVDAVKKFVLEAAENAAKSCPPVLVGIGIGGSFDKVGLLAKKALLRPLSDKNPKPKLASLEEEILAEINKLGIGPAGLGGRVTALGVKIETAPTHIACLPAAVTFNCCAARQAEAII